MKNNWNRIWKGQPTTFKLLLPLVLTGLCVMIFIGLQNLDSYINSPKEHIFELTFYSGFFIVLIAMIIKLLFTKLN